MLSAEIKRKIDREIAKYPPDQRQSAVMSALALAQQEHGWLSTDVMDAVISRHAARCRLRVATFYTMYNLKPQGRFKVAICTNLPCALRGQRAANHLKERPASLQRNDEGRQFTLKEGNASARAATRRCCSSTPPDAAG
jgi:NADH-quinone oxidoreductase subunit E